MSGRQQLLGIRAAPIILEAAAVAIGVGFQGVRLRADLADAILAPPFPMNARSFVSHGNSFGSVVRKWDEFGFSGHAGKLSPFPSLLGALDALLRGGDEIPPNVSRRGEALPAQQHCAGVSDRAQRRCRPRREYREFARLRRDLAD